ncbi:MAG: hypothetical protein FJ087_03265 [Deltaproteobacteria bacterium]|nr:hypothetical protein [Deltaproteobacteria bacterium]
MKRRLVTLCAVLAWAAWACGGGSRPAPLPEDEEALDDDAEVIEGDAADVPPDQAPDAEVPVNPDATETTQGDEAVTPPDGADDVPPTENPVEAEEGTPDVPPDGIEEEVVQSECPCDEGIVAKVCGNDGTKSGTTFVNDQCAKCAICKDAPTCKGCTGTKECGTLPEDPFTGWIAYKAACGFCGKDEAGAAPGVCNAAQKCNDCLGGEDGCPVDGVCGADPLGGKDKTYGADVHGVCGLIQDWGCVIAEWLDCSWADHIVSYGECAEPACTGCDNKMDDPVCMKCDGGALVTFASYCKAQKCPGDHTGCSFEHGGRCLAECAPCAGTQAAPVCGSDTNTYANACAVTNCPEKAGAGVTILWEGFCCPQCENKPKAEVCTEEGGKYDNKCWAEQCFQKGACPETGDDVCGLDGVTYKNDCQSDCFAGGKLHPGACVGVCEQCRGQPLSPVCDQATGKSYQNVCFATCLKSGTTVAGLCTGAGSCTDQCGTIETPKPGTEDGQHCADGLTFPTSCFPSKCFAKATAPTPGACR